MATSTILPNISLCITSLNPEKQSTYLEAPNPPPVYYESPSARLDYVYSAPGSGSGPMLKNQHDYKQHREVAANHPQIVFPVAGDSAAIVTTVRIRV